MSASVRKRIFVVGCSRSGTTLLQGMLANHTRIHTFPETGIFLRAFGMRGPVLPWTRFGLTFGKERKALAKLLSRQQHAPGPLPSLPPRSVRLSRSIADAVEVLDGISQAFGKDVWVEKTPRHVLHAGRIQAAVPDSLCIHLVRKGEDVVASLVDRARRFPDRFPRQTRPSHGIREWNRAIRATADAVRSPGHAVVFYENLVDDAASTLRRLCSVLDLEFQPSMTSPALKAPFIRPAEAWKTDVKGPVAPARSKFGDLFDERTRARIARELDQETYRELAGRASGLPGAVLTGPLEM